MNTELCDLCVKYGTDKGPESMGGWGYSPFYHELLKDHRERVKKVLEVGICGHRDIPNNVIGASLWVWHDYFPNAKIYGIDNDNRWMVGGSYRIKTFCADAYSAVGGAQSVTVHHIGYDIDFIVDDAVHEIDEQVRLCKSLWPFLAQGGLYAIEDVCPYKLPDGNLDAMIGQLPGEHWVVVRTHKPEVLLLGMKV
jgi:hypothetical protein